MRVGQFHLCLQVVIKTSPVFLLQKPTFASLHTFLLGLTQTSLCGLFQNKGRFSLNFFSGGVGKKEEKNCSQSAIFRVLF